MGNAGMSYGESWSPEAKRAIMIGLGYEEMMSETIIWKDIELLVKHLEKHGPEYKKTFKLMGGTMEETTDGGIRYTFKTSRITLYFDASDDYGDIEYRWNSKNKKRVEDLNTITNAMLADRYLDTVKDQLENIERIVEDIQSYHMVKGLQDIAVAGRSDPITINNALSGAKIERITRE